MCGIVGYIGDRIAFPIIIDGLRRLEYRGYDSTGVALMDAEGDIDLYKKKGKVSDLTDTLQSGELRQNIGIGHTRWATHGEPNDRNAHPHKSQNGELALIHNGIIENYQVFRKALTEKGYQFKSDTDTEVLVNLIEYYQTSQNLTLEDAVALALKKVVGAFAIVVMDSKQPDRIIGARRSSPLVMGLDEGRGEFFLASDATPMIQYTNKVIYLKDDEIVTLRANGDYTIKNLSNEVLDYEPIEIDLKLEEIEKGGYDHFMLKEIFQQSETVIEAIRGRINLEENWVLLRGMLENKEKFMNADRILFVSCGTSWHSALIGEYLIEELARVPVEVDYASEFRYRDPIITERDIVVAISQSGETADTLAAIQLAKERGAMIYGVVNVVGSSIARLADSGSYIHAGPEIGVASTKAFTGQVTVLTLMALVLAEWKGQLSKEKKRTAIKEILELPDKIQTILDLDEQMRYIASELKDAENALYLGRGLNFPVALEGALKLKEISYIHAEGYPAAEMKHGPIALIDNQMPVFVIATNQSSYEKIVSNVQEVKARNAVVISIANESAEELKELSDYFIEIPATIDILTPLLSVLPLQLLSYHMAVMRGCNVDQPRNLAKSVTVE